MHSKGIRSEMREAKLENSLMPDSNIYQTIETRFKHLTNQSKLIFKTISYYRYCYATFIAETSTDEIHCKEGKYA
jgi:hypothetical protein